MKHWQGTLLLLALTAFGWGEENNLQKAMFTDVINDVNITSVDKKVVRPAKVNDSFEVPEVVKTGPDSRAELQADDKTITRVGSNTIFSFDKDKRTINLESGSVLFHSPKGMGGGTIKTAAATAAVTGTTIMVGATSNGGFKLLVLEGKSKVTMPNGRVQNLQGGQMTFIVPGSTTPPPVITFRLGSQTEGSKLVSGFEKPLASLPKIQEVTARQEKMIASGKMEGTNLVVGDAKDRKGAQMIDVGGLLQNNGAAGSFQQLATYLDRRFSTGPFTLMGRPPLGEIFRGGESTSGIYQGHEINGNPAGAKSFRLFAAQQLTIDASQVDLGFANGAGMAVLISKDNLQFMRGVNFTGFGGNLHMESFDGQLLFPVISGGSVGETFQYSGTRMAFETSKSLLLNGGTTTANQNLKFDGNAVSFRAGQAMDLTGVSFNASKVELSAGVVNLNNVKFTSTSVVVYADRISNVLSWQAVNTGLPTGSSLNMNNVYLNNTLVLGTGSGPGVIPTGGGGTLEVKDRIK